MPTLRIVSQQFNRERRTISSFKPIKTRKYMTFERLMISKSLIYVYKMIKRYSELIGFPWQNSVMVLLENMVNEVNHHKVIRQDLTTLNQVLNHLDNHLLSKNTLDNYSEFVSISRLFSQSLSVSISKETLISYPFYQSLTQLNQLLHKGAHSNSSILNQSLYEDVQQLVLACSEGINQCLNTQFNNHYQPYITSHDLDIILRKRLSNPYANMLKHNSHYHRDMSARKLFIKAQNNHYIKATLKQLMMNHIDLLTEESFSSFEMIQDQLDWVEWKSKLNQFFNRMDQQFKLEVLKNRGGESKQFHDYYGNESSNHMSLFYQNSIEGELDSHDLYTLYLDLILKQDYSEGTSSLYEDPGDFWNVFIHNPSRKMILDKLESQSIMDSFVIMTQFYQVLEYQKRSNNQLFNTLDYEKFKEIYRSYVNHFHLYADLDKTFFIELESGSQHYDQYLTSWSQRFKEIMDQGKQLFESIDVATFDFFLKSNDFQLLAQNNGKLWMDFKEKTENYKVLKKVFLKDMLSQENVAKVLNQYEMHQIDNEHFKHVNQWIIQYVRDNQMEIEKMSQLVQALNQSYHQLFQPENNPIYHEMSETTTNQINHIEAAFYKTLEMKYRVSKDTLINLKNAYLKSQITDLFDTYTTERDKSLLYQTQKTLKELLLSFDLSSEQFMTDSFAKRVVSTEQVIDQVINHIFSDNTLENLSHHLIERSLQSKEIDNIIKINKMVDHIQSLYYENHMQELLSDHHFKMVFNNHTAFSTFYREWKVQTENVEKSTLLLYQKMINKDQTIENLLEREKTFKQSLIEYKYSFFDEVPYKEHQDYLNSNKYLLTYMKRIYQISVKRWSQQYFNNELENPLYWIDEYFDHIKNTGIFNREEEHLMRSVMRYFSSAERRGFSVKGSKNDNMIQILEANTDEHVYDNLSVYLNNGIKSSIKPLVISPEFIDYTEFQSLYYRENKTQFTNEKMEERIQNSKAIQYLEQSHNEHEGKLNLLESMHENIENHETMIQNILQIQNKLQDIISNYEEGQSIEYKVIDALKEELFLEKFRFNRD